MGDGSAPIREGRHCRGTGGQGDGDLFRPCGQLSSETTRRVEASEWCTPRDRIPGDKIWTIKFKTCHDDSHFQKKKKRDDPCKSCSHKSYHDEEAALREGPIGENTTQNKSTENLVKEHNYSLLCAVVRCVSSVYCASQVQNWCKNDM